jgi:hypothetical protein
MSARAYVLAVIVTVVGLFAILRQVRLRKLRAKYALIWIGAGLVFTPVAVIPGLLDRVSKLLGVAYGPALLLACGLGFFAWLTLHYSTELTRLEERTRVLAEEVALLRDLANNAPTDEPGQRG